MEEKSDKDLEKEKASNTLEKISWELIQKYFKHDTYNLVSHHLDSYNHFFTKEIFDIFKDNNPIRFAEKEVEGKTQNKINVYLGGRDGKLIYFGKPILYDEVDERTPETYSHFMYPNEARLRNLTYGFSIHYDVEVDYDYYVNGENIKSTVILPQIFLGKFPIMLHSDLCILKGMTRDLRFNLGECRNDYGGYFIIDGKEKVIVSQEKFADNMLYVSEVNDSIYSHVANIRSVSEDSSKPKRTTSVRILAPNTKLSNNNIVVSIPNVRKPIPLFIVMRALGVISDKSIIETCLLTSTDSMVDLFVPSIHDANKIFSQEEALCFIALFTKRGGVSSVIEILMNYFLPHVGELNFKDKAYFLGYMVKELLLVFTNQKKSTDRDNFKYKRVEMSGTLIKELFVEYYNIQKHKIFLNIDRSYYYETVEFKDEKFTNLIEDNVHNIFKQRVVEDGFKRAFKGDWGSEVHTKRIGVIQDLNRLTYNSFLSHLRKLNLPLEASAKVVGPRLLHNSQWGYIDPLDSPDGGNIGLHKHLSIMTYISTGFSSKKIIEWLYGDSEKVIPIENSDDLNHPKVFVNGRWIGIVKEPIELVRKIKLYKRNGILPLFLSCSFDYKNSVFIFTDEGRLYRPIYYIDEVNKRISSVRSKQVCEHILSSEYSWESMVSGFLKKPDGYHYKNNFIYDIKDFLEGTHIERTLEENRAVLDYIDVSEEEYLFIANDRKEVANHTNVEIHPSLLFGVMGNQVIYPENNPYPRNAFSCAHGKQAVSIYHSNYLMRIDKTGVVLNYGHTPLIKPKYLELINKEEQPYGNNVICAIMCYNGYNVEDAILINEGAIHRGLFNTTYYSSYESREESSQVKGSQTNSFFTNIQDKDVLNTKPEFFYDKLDKNGLIEENTLLNDKIALIGKVTTIADTMNLYDSSVFPKKGQVGYVDKSFVTDSEEGFRVAKIRIREERIPAVGDKMASRAGQKGTIGIIIKESDMPFTDDGIKPDLIINPHAIPSRMTIGQLLESLFGKLCVTLGCFGDSTAFNMKGSNIEYYKKCLPVYGYHSSGNQILYNGFTGEQMKSEIFIGPTYYSRLKHMVKDKINYRSLGPRTSMTRQTVQGRANDGGLRIGEMERDGVLAHGAMGFLSDSFLKRGDEYYMAVCNQTGMIAIYNKSQNIFLSPYADGPIKFTGSVIGDLRINNISKFGRSFSILKIPYAFKLLIQELQTMNVQLRVITEENIDHIESMNYSNNILKLNNNYRTKTEIIENFVKEYLADLNEKLKQTQRRVEIGTSGNHPYQRIKNEIYEKYRRMSPSSFEVNHSPRSESSSSRFSESHKSPVTHTPDFSPPDTPVNLENKIVFSDGAAGINVKIPEISKTDYDDVDDSKLKYILKKVPHYKPIYDEMSVNTHLLLAKETPQRIERVLSEVYKMVKGGNIKEKEEKEEPKTEIDSNVKVVKI